MRENTMLRKVSAITRWWYQWCYWKFLIIFFKTLSESLSKRRI